MAANQAGGGATLRRASPEQSMGSWVAQRLGARSSAACVGREGGLGRGLGGGQGGRQAQRGSQPRAPG